MNFAYYGIEIEGATVHIQERPFSPVTRMVGGVRLSGDLPGDPYILNTLYECSEVFYFNFRAKSQ